ncbi:hypothetical protein AA313_de0200441 [Arthrobotrys entomopaga]|nr:hypothetical protein AA313_de0200441 [Arthrobotrys entomopaga]
MSPQQKGKKPGASTNLDTGKETSETSSSSDDSLSSNDDYEDEEDAAFREEKPSRTTSYELRSSSRSTNAPFEAPNLATSDVNPSSANNRCNPPEKFKIVWRKPLNYTYDYVREKDMAAFLEVTPDQFQTIKAGFCQMLLRETIFLEHADKQQQGLSWATRDEMCEIAMGYLPLNNEDIMKRLRYISQKDIKGWTLWRLIMGLQKKLTSGISVADAINESPVEPTPSKPVREDNKDSVNISPGDKFRATYEIFKKGCSLEAVDAKADKDAESGNEDTFENVIPDKPIMKTPRNRQARTQAEIRKSQSGIRASPPFSSPHSSKTLQTSFLPSRRSSLAKGLVSVSTHEEDPNNVEEEPIGTEQEDGEQLVRPADSLHKSPDKRYPRNQSTKSPRRTNAARRSTPHRQVVFSSEDSDQGQSDYRHKHRALSRQLPGYAQEQGNKLYALGQESAQIPRWVVNGLTVGVILLWVAVFGLFFLMFSALGSITA